MKIHQIKRNTKLIKSKLVGRGGKRGKTSGKGTKGQKSRSGKKIRPEIRDIIKKIPKLRGRGMNFNKSRFNPFELISLSKIDKVFSASETVSPKTIFEKKLFRKVDGKFPRIKISAGELKSKLTFSGVNFTKSAKEIVEKIGGKIK
ncbi:MAG TPA: uL15 family ribosomal protein [Candidatus Paceibacterota bacterium]|nr:uL15 family ribosomal protein [Candidatus Paceibacterota bacterium]